MEYNALTRSKLFGREQNVGLGSKNKSWGQTDDGRTVDGPDNATTGAIVKGVIEASSITLWNTMHQIGRKGPKCGE